MAARPQIKRVLVAGGTGFVGRAVCAALRARGLTPTVISRGWAPPTDTAPISWKQINLANPWPERWDVEAVINVSGAPVSPTRLWNSAYIKELEESRIATNRALVSALARVPAERRPKTFITMSGVGYYPTSATEQYDESYTNFNPDGDFWSSLTARWEAAAAPASDLGVRVVALRSGVVLGRNGGIFAQMKLPVKFGLGAALGNGQQPFPWIHEHDLANLFVHALANPAVQGPLNGVAPQLIDNNTFTQTFAAASGSKAILSVPSQIISTILGKERATMFCQGQKVIPKKALETGFNFQYPTIDAALKELVAGSGRPEQDLWMYRPGAQQA